jgi:hypothetical protein
MSLPECGPRLAAAAARCSAGQPRATVPTWFVGAARLLLSILRGIFDEAAYSRFLSRHGMRSCPRAYAAFMREQELRSKQRPRFLMLDSA